MKYIALHFYTDFHCIADRCRHTCCAGWEIDIDEEALATYQSITGAFGERLSNSVEITENGASFRLDAQERCPFLNANNLCDIVLTLGEDALCQICRDHPRFRNFFSDRTEIGLGLCCEAAGTLLLEQTERLRFIQLNNTKSEPNTEPTKEERDFFTFREKLFRVFQNRQYPILERLQSALALCGTALPSNSPAQWAEIFLRLERLDDTWTKVLCALQNAPQEIRSVRLPAETDILFEHLAVYFVYRHLAGALEDGLLAARTAFSVLSVQMIANLCKLYFLEHGDLPLPAVAEFTRLYSSEIEYSQENTDALLAMLHGETH